MDYHYHARLTIVGREELAKSVLEGRLSLKEAMAEFKLSRQTVAKWVRRYREQGVAGLRDRSSRPRRSPRQTSKEQVMEIEQLRRGALDRRADRAAAWSESGHHQPGAAPAEAESHP